MKWIVGGFVFAALVVLAGMLVGLEPSPSKDDVESAVRSRLKDPNSADFSEISFHHVKAPSSGKEVDVACGKVNARNEFGGYVGFKRFVAYPASGAAIIEDGAPTDVFDKLWLDGCY